MIHGVACGVRERTSGIDGTMAAVALAAAEVEPSPRGGTPS